MVEILFFLFFTTSPPTAPTSNPPGDDMDVGNGRLSIGTLPPSSADDLRFSTDRTLDVEVDTPTSLNALSLFFGSLTTRIRCFGMSSSSDVVSTFLLVVPLPTVPDLEAAKTFLSVLVSHCDPTPLALLSSSSDLSRSLLFLPLNKAAIPPKNEVLLALPPRSIIDDVSECAFLRSRPSCLGAETDRVEAIP
jgi:hypothetical protein